MQHISVKFTFQNNKYFSCQSHSCLHQTSMNACLKQTFFNSQSIAGSTGQGLERWKLGESAALWG